MRIRQYWTVERGSETHILRASYAVPEEQDRGYVVGDITIDGRSIQFAGQLALRVGKDRSPHKAHRPSAAIAPTLYWVIYVAAVV